MMRQKQCLLCLESEGMLWRVCVGVRENDLAAPHVRATGLFQKTTSCI